MNEKFIPKIREMRREFSTKGDFKTAELRFVQFPTFEKLRIDL